MQQNEYSIAFEEHPPSELHTILLLFNYKGMPMQIRPDPNGVEN